MNASIGVTMTDIRLKCVIIITYERVNFFENYAIVTMESDNVTF